jgi:branched-chain amino acid transport system ATP-binding protein
MLLRITDLRVAYGAVQALHGISVDVPAQGVVALLGANGAGKTTTLRAVSGLIARTGGSVTFDGRELAGMRPDEIAAAGIAHVPEGRRVFARMTVAENLEMGGWSRRAPLADGVDRAFTLFPVLADRRRQQAGTLSGGEQQMLAIARGLVSAPTLLLLDEPSLGLAPLVVKQIFRIIREIRDSGTAVLLVEQNAAQALALADTAYVLDNGSIALHGPAADVAADPGVRRAYLGLDQETA